MLFLFVLTVFLLLTLAPLQRQVITQGSAKKFIRKQQAAVTLPAGSSTPALETSAKNPEKSKASAGSKPKKKTQKTSRPEIDVAMTADITENGHDPAAEARYASLDISENEKMVITEEEESGGKKIMKCYKLIFENNRWVSRLVWTLVSQNANPSPAQ